nr:hypothetical protein [Tanacetum cinerariifolium]
MNDLSYSNTFDLDDMDDIELIMQAIKQDESLQQNEAESSRRPRNLIRHERDLAEARLMADYLMNTLLTLSLDEFAFKSLVKSPGTTLMLERVEVYYECIEPFKSLMRLWVKSKSIAAIWLEKVVTPLIDPAIKVEYRRISLTWFRSCISRSQTEASQSRQTRTLKLFLDFTLCEGSSTLEGCVLMRFID